MNKEMLVSSDKNETRVAILESKQVVQLYFDRKKNKSLAGNIYLGGVENVLKSLDAAFVNIGEEKNAFLYINEIAYDVDLEERSSITKKIQHILKPGQIILAQVTKDPMKGKGARLTNFISLPGRYLVLAPFNDGVGVSRKINSVERERLKALTEEIKPKDYGLIVRTAAKSKGIGELKKDLKHLLKLWSFIKKKTSQVKKPGLIYREHPIVIKLLRDIFSEEFDAIYVDKKNIKRDILKYLRGIGVKFNNIIIHHGQDDLFGTFNVSEVIESALERKVWLKSGGFIVIDYSEALTSIDVNTGKFISGRNSAYTILRTNLEAAEAITTQLKLRDIGGIIVVDFIDMDSDNDKKKVFSRFEQYLKKDKTKTEVLSFSKFGLLEMTRKNVSDGILGTLCKTCPCCDGLGFVKSGETIRLDIERKIRKLARESSSKGFLIKLNPVIAPLVIGKGGKNLKSLEAATKKYIAIKSDENLALDAFVVVLEGPVAEIIQSAKPFKVGDILELEVEEPYSHNKSNALSRIDGYVILIKDGRKYLGKRVTVKINSMSKTSATAEICAPDG